MVKVIVNCRYSEVLGLLSYQLRNIGIVLGGVGYYVYYGISDVAGVEFRGKDYVVYSGYWDGIGGYGGIRNSFLDYLELRKELELGDRIIFLDSDEYLIGNLMEEWSGNKYIKISSIENRGLYGYGVWRGLSGRCIEYRGGRFRGGLHEVMEVEYDGVLGGVMIGHDGCSSLGEYLGRLFRYSGVLMGSDIGIGVTREGYMYKLLGLLGLGSGVELVMFRGGFRMGEGFDLGSTKGE